jgi:hypothetical protein
MHLPQSNDSRRTISSTRFNGGKQRQNGRGAASGLVAAVVEIRQRLASHAGNGSYLDRAPHAPNVTPIRRPPSFPPATHTRAILIMPSSC